MGERMRAFDWAGTTLGAPAAWPQPLKTLLAVMLASGQPMFLAWGSERLLLYNDGYAPMLGRKHPNALGRAFFDVWSEVRDELTPLFESVFGGEPIHMDDIRLMLDRSGRTEEAHFAFSYTPVLDERGAIAGLFCPCTETTEIVLARAQADRERDRLSQLFNQGPSFMAILDGPKHRIELINPAYQRLVGNRKVIGKTVAEALPDAAEQGYIELLDDVFTSGKPFSAAGAKYAVEQTPGGPRDERYVDFLYQPLTDMQGRVSGIFVEGVDVTAARLAERALRESEAQFRAFARAMPNHVWASPPSGQLDWFNDRVYEYGGVPFGSLDGEGWVELVHPEDRSVAGARWAAALASGVNYQTEFRLRRADGSYRWHIARAVAIYGNNGKIIRWIGTNTDIEDQRAATEALRELNDVLELRIEERTRERDRAWRNSQDLRVVIDEKGVFKDVSPAATTILGWAPEDMLGASVFDFIHPDDRGPTDGALEHALRHALPTFENRYRHKDGGYRWLSWVAAPEEGLIYATARNITADKEHQEALVRAQEALRQSQKMEAVGQLTGGLAHDFNNLLTGIAGSLEIMQARIAQGRYGDVARYVDVAQGAAKRAASLTQRLLAFSRRQTLDPKPTDVNRLVIGMEELIRRTMGPSVELEVVGAGGLWPTLVDRSQLENALLNLCINARDAMPAGGRLTIETANKWFDDRAARERDLPPGQFISLCVTDTGTGMTPGVIARAFDPFFTTKPLGEGTGLGLSMIYGFVRQSSGQVRIYSEVGKGTTMCLYLPRHHTEEENNEIQVAGSAVQQSGSGETVLVIDDEPSIRMLIGEVLGEAGYATIEAADGPAGLRILQSAAKIDLLITDVGLPGGMNGRQIADAGRALRPGLKILFITGYAENAAVGNGHLEPGMQVLTKPFAMETLARRIAEIMNGESPVTSGK